MPDSNVPNLDCMSEDEVTEFAIANRGARGAHRLFPAGGKGTVTASRDLVHYAWNKATAMRCRLRGDISTATMYEGICDRIYATLPDFARW